MDRRMDYFIWFFNEIKCKSFKEFKIYRHKFMHAVLLNNSCERKLNCRKNTMRCRRLLIKIDLNDNPYQINSILNKLIRIYLHAIHTIIENYTQYNLTDTKSKWHILSRPWKPLASRIITKSVCLKQFKELWTLNMHFIFADSTPENIFRISTHFNNQAQIEHSSHNSLTFHVL